MDLSTPAAAPEAPAQGTSAPAPAAAPAAPAAAAPEAPKPAAPYVNPWAQPRPAKLAAPAAPAPAASAAAQPAAADPNAAMRAELDALRGALAVTATREMNAVPENVRSYVLAHAGDDPAAQIRALDALRSSGLVGAAPAATAAPAPLPLPANTAPQQPPPAAQTPPTGDTAVLAEWRRLQSAGAHLSAAGFYASNAGAIERALKSATN